MEQYTLSGLNVTVHDSFIWAVGAKVTADEFFEWQYANPPTVGSSDAAFAYVQSGSTTFSPGLSFSSNPTLPDNLAARITAVPEPRAYPAITALLLAGASVFALTACQRGADEPDEAPIVVEESEPIALGEPAEPAAEEVEFVDEPRVVTRTVVVRERPAPASPRVEPRVEEPARPTRDMYHAAIGPHTFLGRAWPRRGRAVGDIGAKNARSRCRG